MIALDTNILVRFLLRDDEAAYRLAVEVFNSDAEIYTADEKLAKRGNRIGAFPKVQVLRAPPP
jgi:predicted nucleic-acid-binding protein